MADNRAAGSVAMEDRKMSTSFSDPSPDNLTAEEQELLVDPVLEEPDADAEPGQMERDVLTDVADGGIDDDSGMVDDVERSTP